MLFVMVSTLSGMGSNLVEFWRTGQTTLLVTGGVIFGLALWLTGEAWVAVGRFRRVGTTEDLEVRFAPPEARH